MRKKKRNKSLGISWGGISLLNLSISHYPSPPWQPEHGDPRLPTSTAPPKSGLKTTEATCDGDPILSEMGTKWGPLTANIHCTSEITEATCDGDLILSKWGPNFDWNGDPSTANTHCTSKIRTKNHKGRRPHKKVTALRLFYVDGREREKFVTPPKSRW